MPSRSRWEINVRSLGKSLLAATTAWRHRLRPDSLRAESPVLQITLDHFCFARYFYSFVKFFEFEGYQIVIRASLPVVYSLSRSQYGNHVLSENLVTVGISESPAVMIDTSEGSAKRLVPYDFRDSDDIQVYDVPMAQHPMMYSRGLWNVPTVSSPGRAVLFIGNCTDPVYSRLRDERLFDVMDRRELIDMLAGSGRVRRVAVEANLSLVAEGGIYLVDSATCFIPMERLREVIASFRFFLCAPGAFMPLCHNLVEALSVGAIPILQRGYADLMPAGLIHGENAFIFENAEDLHSCIEEALGQADSRLEEISADALSYYGRCLTPAAVVRGVLREETRVVRMLAGQHSLDLLRANTMMPS